MYICKYVNTYIHIYIYAYVHICIYIYVYTHILCIQDINIYMYVYTVHIIYVQNIYTSMVEVWDNGTIDYHVALYGETLLGYIGVKYLINHSI